MERAYSEFDKDGKGFFTFEELADHLIGVGASFSKTDLISLAEDIDTDSDKKISKVPEIGKKKNATIVLLWIIRLAVHLLIFVFCPRMWLATRLQSLCEVQRHSSYLLWSKKRNATAELWNEVQRPPS